MLPPNLPPELLHRSFGPAPNGPPHRPALRGLRRSAPEQLPLFADLPEALVVDLPSAQPVEVKPDFALRPWRLWLGNLLIRTGQRVMRVPQPVGLRLVSASD